MPQNRQIEFDGEITPQWLSTTVMDALPDDHGLSSLPGLVTDQLGLSGLVKAYFGARCQCGTAAVISVEASANKSCEETLDVLPDLVERLLAQRDSFRKIPCKEHENFRKGQFMQSNVS